MAKLSTRRRLWTRWLWGAGLPVPHIAAILDITTDVVTERSNRPEQHAYPLRFHARARRRDRAIVGETGNMIRRMTELGYGAAEVANLLWLTERTVKDFLTRITSVRGKILTRPRCRQEQRAGRPHAPPERASYANRGRSARWNHRAANRDDPNQGNAGVPTAAPELAADLLETPAATEPAPCPEPNRWEPDNTREWFRGERHGGHKLTWEKVRAIRRACRRDVLLLARPATQRAPRNNHGRREGTDVDRVRRRRNSIARRTSGFNCAAAGRSRRPERRNAAMATGRKRTAVGRKRQWRAAR